MKIKIALFILTACALEFVSQIAAADALYVGAWSVHIDAAENVNNGDHRLLAYERNGYIVGYFKNSFSEDTGFVAKRFELFERGNWKAAVYVGVDYGYNGCEQSKDTGKNSVCPLVVPELAYTKHKTQIVVSLLGNAIAIGPKWEF